MSFKNLWTKLFTRNCLALASFGTPGAADYLTSYLDYYLDRKDLFYDQATAFCALEYLNKDRADSLVHKWKSFVDNKEHWSLERSRESFNSCMLTIDDIRQARDNL